MLFNKTRVNSECKHKDSRADGATSKELIDGIVFLHMGKMKDEENIRGVFI